MSDLPEGAVLGRYRVTRRLGSGAMGDVYVAEDPQIDRRVAIKTVRLLGARDEEIEERKRRLVREAKAAGRLIHPHVVTLFDAGEQDGICYLAFELVDGPDLAERLRQEPPLTVGEALRIARETLEALDFAHHNGIIHRDVKPSNILLDRQAGVKVSDFGIAKLVGQTSELTMSGSVVGSPHYLSPEQIKGEELDGRSDLFSLGVVLYEMLARGRPFAGETITTLVYQILHTDPPAVSARHPEISQPVVSLVARLMAKDRDQRFSNAGEAVAAVRQVEASLSPAELAEAGKSADLTEATRLIQTGPTAHVGAPAPTQMSGAPADTPKRSRSRAGLLAALFAAVVVAGAAGAGWYWFHVAPRRAASKLAASQTQAVAGPVAATGSQASGIGVPTAANKAATAGAASTAAQSHQKMLSTAPKGKKATLEEKSQPADEGRSLSRRAASAQPEKIATPGSLRSASVQEAHREGPGTPKAEQVGGGSSTPDSEPSESAATPHPDVVADGGLQVQLRAAPKDSIVAIRGPGDSRFRTLGRADELPGKDQIHLPGSGNYLVRLRRERMKDFVAQIHAKTGLPPAQIVAHMREIQAKELTLGDLQHFRAGEAIGFEVDPSTARVLVDGKPVGMAKEWTGRRFGRGRWLQLKPGVWRVSLEAPGYKRKDIAVEIFPGAEPARRRLRLSLEPAN